VEALAALSALRKVVVDAARAPLAGSALFGLPVTVDSANGVVDQLMLEAVDAASANLRTLARTDPLTGCANRLALREDLSYAAGAAARSGLDLSVVALDLDGLKKINDTKGHAAGDAALRALVARLSAELRDADTLYRTGGDEFVVVAPFTDTAGAAAMLERASGGGGPSFSWGVASMRAMGARAAENPELLTAAADSDLYALRRNTRRRRASGERRHRAMNARTAVALAGAQVHSTMSSLKRHRRLVASFAASAILGAAAAGGLIAGLSHGTRPSGAPSASRAPVQRHRAPSASKSNPPQQGPTVQNPANQGPNPANQGPNQGQGGAATSVPATSVPTTSVPATTAFTPTNAETALVQSVAASPQTKFSSHLERFVSGESLRGIAATRALSPTANTTEAPNTLSSSAGLPVSLTPPGTTVQPPIAGSAPQPQPGTGIGERPEQTNAVGEQQANQPRAYLHQSQARGPQPSMARPAGGRAPHR
jgi:GGDEF domain-containing protein